MPSERDMWNYSTWLMCCEGYSVAQQEHRRRCKNLLSVARMIMISSSAPWFAPKHREGNGKEKKGDSVPTDRDGERERGSSAVVRQKR